MSFSAVASYPNIKGAGMFSQGYEDLGAEFFDQFLTYGPEDNETPDYSTNQESSSYLEQSTRYESANGSSSSIDEASHGMASWQHASWAPDNHDHDHDHVVSSFNSASGDQFYGISARAAISDTELLSLEGIQLECPRADAYSHRSLPSSPTLALAHPPLRRKSRVVESLSKTFKKATANLDKSLLRSPIRKQKSTPKIMGATHGNQNHSSSHLVLWDLKPDKFKFDFERDDAPPSPPPSSKAPDAPQLAHSHSDPQKRELLDGFTYKTALTRPQHTARSTAYDTPLSTPTLDNNNYPSRRTSQQLRSGSALFPITPQAQNASGSGSGSGSWSQLPNSPGSNSLGATSIYPEIESLLWCGHAATAPMAQPSPRNFHSNAQQTSKTIATQLQNDLAYNSNNSSNHKHNDLPFGSPNMANGLMIQMPESATQQSFVMGTPPQHSQGYFPSPRSQSHHYHHQQQQQRHHRQPSGNRQASHHARPRHPQLSSPVIRKSRSTSSDSDSEPPSPLPRHGQQQPALHVRKRKTKSSKQATPRTPSSSSSITAGAVDFVNYTPSDSRKILTGVAPSGSSKTKARREKEALDKRRKLSQAAMRAVQAAGGDVESLVEEGLLV
ncbi:hypothetical protein LZ554_000830 [Drepanopeziza brunnea f. sp. 'monogermtubi']|nr:hypothetical protein LZ554_000830 [Drepanopeziza brunnea f. sp. 'monogermtubi']